MPALVGLLFDGKYEFGQLACLDNARAVRPDGRVVYEHGSSSGLGHNRIVSVSPPPGTPIGRHDPVTVNVVEEDAVPPSGLRPCDSVSESEASELLGGSPVTTDTLGDLKGSTDISCGFTTNDSTRGISSWLALMDARIIDAATEFDFQMAHGNEAVNTVDGLGVQAACVLRNHPSGAKHQLWVVLPGERIYIVSDSGDRDNSPVDRPGESCETLTQFAQTAIPRIGS